jgi:hypothetical protein
VFAIGDDRSPIGRREELDAIHDHGHAALGLLRGGEAYHESSPRADGLATHGDGREAQAAQALLQGWSQFTRNIGA